MKRALPALAVVLAGCASVAGFDAAVRGDRAALRVAIATPHGQGKLRDDDAAKLARVVAAKELANAKGDDATKRVEELRGCAIDLKNAFEERASEADDAGAEAALALLEDGAFDVERARAFVNHPNERWRAVGVRSLVYRADDDDRRLALRDPSPLVRRAAVRAIREADAVTGEREALIEVVRVDPDALVRVEAVRSLALRGGIGVALALEDSWARADEPLREAIATAWAAPALFDDGGKNALAALAASAHGPAAIAGAAQLLARRGARDENLDASAAAVLVRAIAHGSRRDKLHALAVARLFRGEIAEAIRGAAKETDADVRLAALTRLTELPADRAAAVAALEELARPPARNGARARFALARAGDTRAQAWLELDLTSDDPALRIAAAQGLLGLGRAARAATLLADDRADVRTRASCILLQGARRRR